jgi:hypothetical protein
VRERLSQHRAMIKSGERSQRFGLLLVVDYTQVQTKFGLKYHTWRSELQEMFTALLNNAARDQLSAHSWGHIRTGHAQEGTVSAKAGQ